MIGVANDMNFRWVSDMGLPGPGAGKGGKHIILPPDYKGKVPAGYYAGTSTTYRVFLIIRSMPLGGEELVRGWHVLGLVHDRQDRVVGRRGALG